MKILTNIFAFLIIFLPIFALSAPSTDLIVCNKELSSDGKKFTDPCTFNMLVQLGVNIINFLILLAIPLATISFIWAGFLLVTSAGNLSKVEHAKEIFKKTIIGFLFVLGAWLIVKTIVSALLHQPFTLLG